MTRPKAVTISRPFDARHVGGVSIQGGSTDIQRAFTSLEPDEVPTHMDITSQKEEARAAAPRRSNTIAHSLSRPSLRLKTSISRLRGRSSSNSPDTYRKKERDTTPDPLPKTLGPLQPLPPLDLNAPSARPVTSHPSNPILKRQASSNKPLPLINRPKRADSGTAIDFDDVPVEERPMGFQEIMAVKSFAERMECYRKTREYWAKADHGLGEWVGKAGRPLVAQV